MSTIIDQEKIENKKYLVSIDLIDNNILETLSEEAIISLLCENDYINNFFPILKVDLMISTRLFRLIVNNRNTIKFRIKLESYILAKNNKSNDYNSETNKKIVFHDIFQPFLPKELTDDTKSELNDSQIDEDDPTRSLEVYLFNLDAMNNNKKIVNFIAQDCKIKDAIGYIINQFKIKSLLMSNPSNNTRYEQLINPPLNLRNSIEYLSNTYGIYNSGVRQFYDNNVYYLLSNDINNVPVKPGEYQNVYMQVCKIKNEGSVNQGSYKDDDYKCYMVNINNTMNLISNGILNKELNGNKLRVYNRDSLENAVIYNEKTGKFKFNKGYNEIELDLDAYESNDKVAYLFNNSSDTTVSSMEANMKYSNIEFNIQFVTIDLEIFTPNRNYIFRFEDAKYFKYNGSYIMDAITYIIDNTKGDISGMAKFRKVK